MKMQAGTILTRNAPYCIIHAHLFSSLLFRPQKIRSQTTQNPQNPQVPQKTILAGLQRSVACFSSLFPPLTFSSVPSASSTKESILSAWIDKFAARVVWSSDISRMDCSAVLFYFVSTGEKGVGEGMGPGNRREG